MLAPLVNKEMLDYEAKEKFNETKKRNLAMRRSGTKSILKKFVAWYLKCGYDDFESAIDRYVEEEIQ